MTVVQKELVKILLLDAVLMGLILVLYFWNLRSGVLDPASEQIFSFLVSQ